MALFKNQKQKRITILCLSLFLAVSLCVLSCGIYLADYYPAKSEAIEAFTEERDVKQTALQDGSIVIEPKDAP